MSFSGLAVPGWISAIWPPLFLFGTLIYYFGFVRAEQRSTSKRLEAAEKTLRTVSDIQSRMLTENEQRMIALKSEEKALLQSAHRDRKIAEESSAATEKKFDTMDRNFESVFKRLNGQDVMMARVDENVKSLMTAKAQSRVR